MKLNTRRTVSAALAGTMVLSLSIPVFGAAMNDSGNSGIHSLNETEAKESTEGAEQLSRNSEKKSVEIRNIFWDAAKGSDAGSGLTAETAVASLEKAAALAGSEAGVQARVVICHEAALTGEESAMLTEKKLSTVSLTSYQAEMKAAAEKTEAAADETVIEAAADKSETEAAADKSETEAAADASEIEAAADENEMEAAADNNEMEAAADYNETEDAVFETVEEENTEIGTAAAEAEADLTAEASVETHDPANSEKSLNNPGETLLPAPPASVSPIPPISAEQTGEEDAEEVILLSAAGIAAEPVLASVPMTVSINESIAVAPVEASEPEPAGEVQLLTVPGRDLVGTGTSKSINASSSSSSGSGASSQDQSGSAGSGAASGSSAGKGSGGSAGAGTASGDSAGQAVAPADGAKGPSVPVNTADEMVYFPYILSAMISGAGLVLFNKLNLDSRRKCKSSVYAEEMEAFRKACKMD